MNIILLGAPGGGKGTQAVMIREKFQVTHLSTGELFREEIKKGSELGKKVQSYVTGGKLVPDQLVVDVVTGRLGETQGGVLLDGFPRTVEQARALDNYLTKNGRKIDVVIYLNVKDDEVVKRLSARRFCSQCKEDYNAISKPSKTGDKCEKCGGPIVQRDDDKPETIKKRLMVFHDLTMPLVAYYRTNGVFEEVEAADSPQEVGEMVAKVIQQAAGN